MITSWSEESVREFLDSAVTPVRDFIKKLASKDRATLNELMTPPTAAATFEAYFRRNGLDPLFRSEVDDSSGREVYFLDPEVRGWATSYFEGNPDGEKRSAAKMTSVKSLAWSKSELEEFLATATPMVREFLRGLLDRPRATTIELRVPHTAPTVAMRYFKAQGKPSLYERVSGPKETPAAYALREEFRDRIAEAFGAIPAAAPEEIEALALRGQRKPRAPRRRVMEDGESLGGSYDAPAHGPTGDGRTFELQIATPDEAAKLISFVDFLNQKATGHTFRLETNGRDFRLIVSGGGAG